MKKKRMYSSSTYINGTLVSFSYFFWWRVTFVVRREPYCTVKYRYNFLNSNVFHTRTFKKKWVRMVLLHAKPSSAPSHHRRHMLQKYYLAANKRFSFSSRNNDVKFNRVTTDVGKERQQGQLCEGQGRCRCSFEHFLHQQKVYWIWPVITQCEPKTSPSPRSLEDISYRSPMRRKIKLAE